MRASAQNTQQLRRDCALIGTTTLWISWPDSHKLTPETPNTSSHNEARRSWTCKHASGERSRAILMLIRIELCVHRKATLNNRMSLSCSRYD